MDREAALLDAIARLCLFDEGGAAKVSASTVLQQDGLLHTTLYVIFHEWPHGYAHQETMDKVTVQLQKLFTTLKKFSPSHPAHEDLLNLVHEFGQIRLRKSINKWRAAWTSEKKHLYQMVENASDHFTPQEIQSLACVFMQIDIILDSVDRECSRWARVATQHAHFWWSKLGLSSRDLRAISWPLLERLDAFVNDNSGQTGKKLLSFNMQQWITDMLDLNFAVLHLTKFTMLKYSDELLRGRLEVIVVDDC